MGLTTQTFDIISRIAIGNGALVYRAVEKSTLRQVALKLLSQDGELDHRMDLDALFAAAPQLKQISGAHVCQLLDAYSDDDGPVLVYEFANGMSGAELPHQRKLDATQLLDVAAQIISSLRSGERQRTPHGDLKPSNILFVDLPDGRPYTFVLDWGLAAFRSDMREDSLPFLAPERLGDAPPSHTADLFSAGAVLFYLATGTILVAGCSREALAAAWGKVNFGVLAEMRPDLPPKFVQWITSLLALTPAQRPASAVEAGTTLATLNPPPPLAPPESIRPRPAPASRVAPAPQPSAIRPAQSGIQSAPVPVPVPRIAPQQPAKKKSGGGWVLGMLAAMTLTVGAFVWFIWKKKKDDDKIVAPASDAGKPARTPAPSVSAPVKKQDPVVPPPTVASATPKPADNKQPAPLKVNAPQPPTPAPPPAADAAPADPIFIATEDFSYPANSALDGLAAGTGWQAPWRGPDATVQASSLSHPNHPAKGGSLLIPETDGEFIWRRTIGSVGRFLKDPTKSGHWYFAALVQHSDDSPAPGGEIRFNLFDTADPHNLFQVVVADTGPGLKISLNDPRAAIELPDASKPVFIVVRIEFTNPKLGNWDVKVRLLVNPNIASKDQGSSVPKAIEGKKEYASVPKEMGLLIRKKRSQATSRVDEIRFGKHWEEMTFKPPQLGGN